MRPVLKRFKDEIVLIRNSWTKGVMHGLLEFCKARFGFRFSAIFLICNGGYYQRGFRVIENQGSVVQN